MVEVELDESVAEVIREEEGAVEEEEEVVEGKI